MPRQDKERVKKGEDRGAADIREKLSSCARHKFQISY
jgi:hypothetical protein